MPFNIPAFETIRDEILRDLKSLNPDVDISADSDYHVRASSIASCVSGNYAHQAWIVKQIFPDTADSEYLAMHAGLRGIYRKQPTPATATITITGDDNTTLVKDTEIKPNNSDIVFKTTVDITIEDGTAEVVAIADKTGLAGNITAQQGKLLSAPAGIESTVNIKHGQGGTDSESDAGLLARLLDRLRRPPAGGNKNDYKQWALSVSGVENAYIYPLRRGLGTVDIVITTRSGLPSQTTLDEVKQYIDEVRPVTAKDIAVIAPDVKKIDIKVKVKSDENTADLMSKIKTNLETFFSDLEPANGLVKSQIESAISETIGVIDRQLITPNSNLSGEDSGKINWYQLGNLSLEVLND